MSEDPLRAMVRSIAAEEVAKRGGLWPQTPEERKALIAMLERLMKQLKDEDAAASG